MTAKDSSGTNIGVGGDIFFIEITNAWTKGSNYECAANSGRETVLASDLVHQMTDNLDGTYTYNFSVSRPGQITVSILQYTLGGVYQEYYASNNFNGNNAYNSTISDNINFDWGSGIIYSSRAIDVSAKFYFRFKAPISDIITFYIYVDDNTTMSVGKETLS